MVKRLTLSVEVPQDKTKVGLCADMRRRQLTQHSTVSTSLLLVDTVLLSCGELCVGTDRQTQREREREREIVRALTSKKNGLTIFQQIRQ